MTAKRSRRRGCGYWLRLLTFGVVGGLILVGNLVNISFAATYTQPANQPLQGDNPGERGLAYENVSFTSEPGVTLAGWYLPPHNGAVIVLLHGISVSGGDRSDMLDHAEFLARAGYGALLYDLRGHGESLAPGRSFGWRDTRDVDAAVDWLLAREEVERIGILGFSLGGQIALRAAAGNDRIGAVVADGPSYARYHDLPPAQSWFEVWIHLDTWLGLQYVQLFTGIFDPPPAVIDVIGDIAPRPLLLISTGRADESGSSLEHLYATYYFEHAGEPKTLWNVPEAMHGGGLAARADEYAANVLALFDAAFAP